MDSSLTIISITNLIPGKAYFQLYNYDFIKDSLVLFENDSIEINLGEFILDGHLDEKKSLIFLTNLRVHIKSVGESKFKNSKNSRAYDEILQSGEQVFLYKNYNFNPSITTVKSEIGHLNRKNLKISKSVRPSFDCYPCTHRVNQFISANSTNIVFSLSLRYDLSFFQADLTLDTSIVMPDYPVQFNLTLPEIEIQGKEDVLKFIHIDENIARIEKVWLSDTHLLVSRKNAGDSKRRRIVDVYKFVPFQKAPIFLYSTIVKTELDKNDVVRREKFQPRLADSNPSFLVGNRLVMVSEAPMDLKSGITWGEILSNWNTKFISEEPRFSILVLEVSDVE